MLYMTLSLKNKIQRCRPLLGTFVEITVEHADQREADAAMDAAFVAIERVQQLMSFHDAASEVSRLNRLAARENVFVSPETYEVIRWAKEFHERTNGIFDIAVAPELIALESLPRHAFLTDENNGNGRTRDIELRPNGSIRFLRPLYIDLGGIAKGFAVDKAVEVLKENGMESAVVNAGGDLRCFGEEEQPVWVRHPMNPGQLLPLPALKNAALATSANSYEKILGRALGTHIHGITRKLVQRSFSVSVRADSCLAADALTKVVLISGEEGASFLASFNAAVFIVYPDNRILFCEGKSHEDG